MIIVTSDHIEGKRAVKTLGLVKGSTIRARNIGRDITAGLRGIVGGEIMEYTKLMAEAREEAIARMVKQAEEMGANAIVDTRFVTSMVMSGASELLVYGTAIVVEA
ncbi:MAG: YbjQ family protein [Chloroflexota bacterium]|nr:YbjQ family protein [Chloroflexota bacterium]